MKLIYEQCTSCGTMQAVRAVVEFADTPIEPLDLSDAETRIVEQYMLGRDAAVISETLGIKPNTVRKHTTSILAKAGVTSVLQLISMAYKNGGYLY